jgi:hypothetical protein
MNRRVLMSAVVISAAILAGCTDDKPAPVQSIGPNPAGEKLLLSSEPAGAKNVMDLLQNAKNGDEVVVVGRIGGEVNPWHEGKAGFLIADCSLIPCNERPNDPCETPWDYCCDARRDEGLASVKFVDGNGQVIPIDARTLLGFKVLNTVVIKGKVERNDSGKFIVLATGAYRRPDSKK